VKPNDKRLTFNCGICPFKTLFRTSLIRHNRRMHGNITANSVNSPQSNSRGDDGDEGVIGGTETQCPTAGVLCCQ